MLSAVITTCPAPQKAHLGVSGLDPAIPAHQLLFAQQSCPALWGLWGCGAVQGCEDAAKIQEFVACQVPAEAVSLPMVTLLATGQTGSFVPFSHTPAGVFVVELWGWQMHLSVFYF